MFHIFRKDARHHWPEAAISLALLAALIWLQPSHWTGLMEKPDLQLIEAWLSALVPISWAFLIVRLVQDENLVGDRQFWVTRPYDWRKLLAEKILFIFVGMTLPLFIAQLVLLKMAGFPPLAYIAGLLLLELLWLLFLALPAMTLSALTSSVGQAVVVVLGAIVCLVGIGIAMSDVNSGSSLVRQQSFLSSIPTALGFAAAAAVVIWQYARRRTLKARVALIAVIVIAAFVLPPLIPDKNIARAYPYFTGGERVPVQLAFDDHMHELGTALAQKKTVTVRLPFTVSGISEGSIVYVDGAQLTIRAPDGREWHSNWQSGRPFFPNSSRTAIDFEVDRQFYDAVKMLPVNAQVTFALAIDRESQPVALTAKAGGFGIPGNGRCSIIPTGDVLCLFPVKVPALSVEVPSDGFTCPVPPKGNPLPAGLTGYEVTRRFDVPAVDFGISSVQTEQIFSWKWDFGEPGDKYSAGGICPGTPLRIGFVTEERGMRADVPINGIKLIDYTPKLVPRLGLSSDFSVGIW